MPALPWMRVGTADLTADPGAEVIVFASRLSLRCYRHIPRLLTQTWSVRRHLVEAPGLIGYSLDAQLLDKTFWTVSAWRSRPDLGGFERSQPHQAVKEATRAVMLPSTFVMWRCRLGDLPVAWPEVHGRIQGAGNGMLVLCAHKCCGTPPSRRAMPAGIPPAWCSTPTG